MESVRKIIALLLPLLCVSCATIGPITLLEIKPLPREIVIEKTVEYEPVYAVLKIREISEENGVPKYLFAKLESDIPEITAGVMGEIAADASFGEIIGTFKVLSVSGGFVRGSIESLTHKVPKNSLVRIQIGQKIKDVK